MSEKDLDVYGSLYISDLEGGLRRGETGLSFVLMSFFLFGVLIFTALSKSYAIPVFAADITNDIVGEPRQTVDISAYVPSFLGLKKLGSQDGRKNFMAYGNSEYGFSVADIKSGETLYKYDAMPGEGIIIKLGREIESLFFDSNF